MPDRFDFHDKRAQNKIGLEMYFLDKVNTFDIAIDQLIEDIKRNIRKNRDLFEGWHNLEKEDPERYVLQVEDAERYEINIDLQQYETLSDIQFYEDQLLSLAEMKIVYSFKCLEINIKKLLSTSFNLTSVKDLHRWEFLVNFLKDQNINIKGLKGYNEIVQLKDVNNAIKHSGDYGYSPSISSITEFRNSEELSYIKLDSFYHRINKSPDIFLQELISAIYNELYTFDKGKIELMAKAIALRMGKEDANSFMDLLKKIYNQE